MAMKTDAVRSCTMSTPDGPFTIVTGHGGADGAADGVARTDYVLASGWTAEIAELVGLIHPGLRPSHTEALPEVECDGLLACAVAAVRSYYCGESSAPGDVPVLQVGGPLVERAWSRLREVPAGTTLTYTELARVSGNPAASRAAASACARNAAALFVPCHRSDGGIGGFRYGVAVKSALPRREETPGLE
ncbi:methylated-DNA--[protein]-cysteine S-methyltransferase [Actinomyces naeslundii]|uniref:methylated-DNA--[protein]-cysteine S-methyltransferase n=1 Tax=Actinomyces naeslundii TaxID=1655 RepID=UPI00096BEF4D|nr:methylated-DNA--[protein]-cysteine S-methyltransferase [Actinomyces naeslundii]OMG09004.1 cysteine methyltransferase [Actinomyces naeslundii]OMG17159.1 cysteine methyltransferase [Actinomyces naeslundii]